MNQTQKTKVKLLLVDDHQLFNDGLKSLLSTEDDLEIVGQLYDAKNILLKIHQFSPQIIFLDVNLPDNNGIEISKSIIKEFPSIKIILLTMYSDYSLLKEAQKIGIHGYILKNSALKDLVQGIRVVLDGKTYYDSRVFKQNEKPEKNNLSKKLALTDREIEIIRFIKDGLDSYEIAKQISLTYLTVKTHRRNIHFKLGTNSTAELIRFASENNI